MHGQTHKFGSLQRLLALVTAPEKWLYSSNLLSPGDITLPDFLGIGLPQSGTSWLYENLRRHPELFLAEVKELHYFDRYFHRSLRGYATHFKPGASKVKGEITPGYGRLWPERIGFIRKLIPNVRLILLLRNPIDQQWSSARRILSSKTERALDEVDDSCFYRVFQGLDAKRGDYLPGPVAKSSVGILRNWLDFFPREQLFIGYFDDIVNRPVDLLRDMFTHLGVSREVAWRHFPHSEVVNKNPDHPLPVRFRAYLEEMHRDDITVLCGDFGAPAGWLKELNSEDEPNVVATQLGASKPES